jgi:hypothetical protein
MYLTESPNRSQNAYRPEGLVFRVAPKAALVRGYPVVVVEDLCTAPVGCNMSLLVLAVRRAAEKAPSVPALGELPVLLVLLALLGVEEVEVEVEVESDAAGPGIPPGQSPLAAG